MQTTKLLLLMLLQQLHQQQNPQLQRQRQASWEFCWGQTRVAGMQQQQAQRQLLQMLALPLAALWAPS